MAHARRGNQQTAAILNARLGRLTAGSLPALAQVVIELTEHRAWEEGEPHARNAVRIAPQDPDAHRRLGVILIMRMHAKEGEYHLRRALALSGDPKGVSALLLVRLAAAMNQLHDHGRRDQRGGGKTLERRGVLEQARLEVDRLRLHGPEQLLDGPAPAVERHDVHGILERRHRTGGEQAPTHRLPAGRRIDLAHLDRIDADPRRIALIALCLTALTFSAGVLLVLTAPPSAVSEQRAR